MRNIKSRILKRAFLNSRNHGGIALVVLEGTFAKKGSYNERRLRTDPSTKPDPRENEIDFCFTIGDCNRQITLEFSSNRKEIRNSLRKLEILKACLDDIEYYIHNPDEF